MIEIEKILQSFSTRKVLVLGDVMLDHYIWGRVDRISPEAPVPVLDVQKEECRLGGAANVALNLKALGAEVYLSGVIGNDPAGEQIRQLLSEHDINADALITDPTRSSTRKTRIGAVTQQIVRLDNESRRDLDKEREDNLIILLETLIPGMDAVILEDYNKGVLTEKVIAKVIDTAARQKVIVTVDPKQKNFFSFLQVDVFKPNYSEMQKNLGIMFDTDEQFVLHAWKLRERIGCRHLVVTRGEKGLSVFTEGQKMFHIPTFAREIYDVSGAGDTVIGVLTLALCEGCDIETAAIIANHAAGIVCGKMGTATVSLEEIRKSCHDHR